MIGIQIWAVATTQNQSFSGKEVTIRVDTEIKCSSIFPSSVVNILQRLLTDRKKFTFIICGTG